MLLRVNLAGFLHKNSETVWVGNICKKSDPWMFKLFFLLLMFWKKGTFSFEMSTKILGDLVKPKLCVFNEIWFSFCFLLCWGRYPQGGEIHKKSVGRLIWILWKQPKIGGEDGRDHPFQGAYFFIHGRQQKTPISSSEVVLKKTEIQKPFRDVQEHVDNGPKPINPINQCKVSSGVGFLGGWRVCLVLFLIPVTSLQICPLFGKNPPQMVPSWIWILVSTRVKGGLIQNQIYNPDSLYIYYILCMRTSNRSNSPQTIITNHHESIFYTLTFNVILRVGGNNPSHSPFCGIRWALTMEGFDWNWYRRGRILKMTPVTWGVRILRGDDFFSQLASSRFT